MPVGVLLLQLVAGQRHLRRIDHDHEIARVHVRGEDRLVLAPEQHGHVAGQAAEHHVGSVDDMPLPRNVTVLRAECAHSPKPSRMYRDLLRPHLLVTTAHRRSAGASRRANRAYGRHTACMPVAHDANAAYSVSRSDAKATSPSSPPQGGRHGFAASQLRENGKLPLTSLPELNRTLLSTLWITRAQDAPARPRTRAVSRPGRRWKAPAAPGSAENGGPENSGPHAPARCPPGHPDTAPADSGLPGAAPSGSWVPGPARSGSAAQAAAPSRSWSGRAAGAGSGAQPVLPGQRRPAGRCARGSGAQRVLGPGTGPGRLISSGSGPSPVLPRGSGPSRS